jgi:hypothetical protein
MYLIKPLVRYRIMVARGVIYWSILYVVLYGTITLVEYGIIRKGGNHIIVD